jgi:hypothetical protein
MMKFKDVTIIKKANVYFDGKVTSRTVIFPDGTKNWVSCFPEIMNSTQRKRKSLPANLMFCCPAPQIA